MISKYIRQPPIGLKCYRTNNSRSKINEQLTRLNLFLNSGLLSRRAIQGFYAQYNQFREIRHKSEALVYPNPKNSSPTKKNTITWAAVTREQQKPDDTQFQDSLPSINLPFFQEILKSYEEIGLLTEYTDVNRKADIIEETENDTIDLQVNNGPNKDWSESLSLQFDSHNSISNFTGKQVVDDCEPKITLDAFRRGDVISFGICFGIIVEIRDGMLTVLDYRGNLQISGHINVEFHYPRFMESLEVRHWAEVRGEKAVKMLDAFNRGEAFESHVILTYLIASKFHEQSFQFQLSQDSKLTSGLNSLIQKMNEKQDLFEEKEKENSGIFRTPWASTNIWEFYNQICHGKEAGLEGKNYSGDRHDIPLARAYGIFRFLKTKMETCLFDKDKRNTFDIYPKKMTELFKTFEEFTEKKEGPYLAFLDKCSRLVNYRVNNIDWSASEDIGHPILNKVINENTEPGKAWMIKRKIKKLLDKDLKNITFNDNDQVFIQTLKEYVLISKLEDNHSISNSIAQILKPLGYSYVNSVLVFKFLMDIGAISPNENLNLYHYKFKLPEKYNTNTPSIIPNFEEIKDLYSDIRVDKKDLLVYTIDNKEANEIDDGLSIEIEPDNTKWINIHIADPTTIINNNDKDFMDHLISQPETLYLPNAAYPMLPNHIAHGPCSLGGQGKKYCLTFSAKLDEAGEIVDFKIQPQIIQNIIQLNYDQVDEWMNWKSPVILKLGKDQDEPSNNNINDQNKYQIINGLKCLSKSINSYNKNRLNKGYIPVRFETLEIRTKMPEYVNHFDKKPHHPDFKNTTIPLEHNVQVTQVNEINSRSLVSDLMNLAGDVASRYLAKHKLPAFFLSQAPPNPKQNPIKYEIMRELLKKGSLKQQDYLYLRGIFNPVKTGLDMEPHTMLGLDNGYVKITSPLRRASDLLMHWQIKHHLKKGQPLFSRSELEQIYIGMHPNLYMLRRTAQRTEKLFLLDLLQRIPTLYSSDLPLKVHRPNLPNATDRLVFKGILVGFNPIVNEWLVLIKGLQFLSIYKGNINESNQAFVALNKHKGTTTNTNVGKLAPKEVKGLKVGDEVEMVVYSLVKSMNSLAFMGLNN